ncbi:diacylglycerol kinase (ATP) [Kitasatospora sp. MAP12-15]|uniref:diacylglycerol kinase n=1 Tax=unclassified Kitasatospora TaxID=2633591 RepID=UPI0024768BEC|nr:diacylglycerol kinase [Kitasatospora sp. MAP12-44]MDH6115004.1 diacylglycerol kinase (ATP) [Kitasatospora sp. MAP12-44]
MTTAPVRRAIASAVVLTNPAAGGGHAARAAERAIARLRERGVQVRPVTGTDPADALRLAREAVLGEADVLVVVGGDGMIALALQALAGSTVPLGVIPAGTGNDHAREYGLPLKNPEAAADVIAEGQVLTVDVGRIDAADGSTRYFGSVLATGFDSLVSDRANRLTWPRGRMRYNLAMLVELAGLRPLAFRLVLGDGTVVEEQLTLAAVGNTRSYGGGMAVCPGADPADGLLDVTLVRAMPRRTLVRFFPTVFKGTHVRRSEVATYRTAALRIESPGINAYADGDYAGPLPIDVTVLPGALGILVPSAV